MSAPLPIADRLDRRNRRTTPPEPVQERSIVDQDLAKLIRDAVHLEMRSTIRVELEEHADMKDKLLVILAVTALAGIIGFSVALAFSLWLPG